MSIMDDYLLYDNFFGPKAPLNGRKPVVGPNTWVVSPANPTEAGEGVWSSKTPGLALGQMIGLDAVPGEIGFTFEWVSGVTSAWPVIASYLTPGAEVKDMLHAQVTPAKFAFLLAKSFLTSSATSAGGTVLNFDSLPTTQFILGGTEVRDMTNMAALPNSPPPLVTAVTSTTTTMSPGALQSVGAGDTISFFPLTVQFGNVMGYSHLSANTVYTFRTFIAPPQIYAFLFKSAGDPEVNSPSDLIGWAMLTDDNIANVIGKNLYIEQSYIESYGNATVAYHSVWAKRSPFFQRYVGG